MTVWGTDICFQSLSLSLSLSLFLFLSPLHSTSYILSLSLTPSTSYILSLLIPLYFPLVFSLACTLTVLAVTRNGWTTQKATVARLWVFLILYHSHTPTIPRFQACYLSFLLISVEFASSVYERTTLWITSSRRILRPTQERSVQKKTWRSSMPRTKSPRTWWELKK